MEQTYLFYYIGAGLIAILIIVSIYFSFKLRKQNQQKGLEKKDYIRALNCLIEGDLTKAVEYFHNSVRNDTENIDAYLKLGDIFRQQNKVDKAIKIHSELLVRRNLDHTTKSEIIRSLVLDYIALKNYSKALENLNGLIAVEPKNHWAKKQQLVVYEAQMDWDNAFKTFKLLSKFEGKKEINDRLALYKVENAKKSIANKKEKEGRILLREAIKLYPTCSAAHIELGDSYVREERYTDAIKVWVEFVRKVPSHSYLVFDRLQEVLYSSGSYGEIENILQELHQEYPTNLDVMFTLADVRSRKGDTLGAIQLYEFALEKYPESNTAKLKLVILYDRNDEKEKALEIAKEVADKSTDFKMEFICTVCNNKTNIPLWHCPKCNSWKSFNL
jgi:lipopolysaccharide assembly protein B